MTSNSDDLVDALVRTSFTVMGPLTRIAADHELSLTQLRVLAILRDRTVGMSALVDYLGLEKSTLTGLVNRAVTRGLLQRVPNADDRRAVDVTATRSGRALARKVYSEVQAELRPLLAHLSAAERARAGSLLTRLLEGPSI